MVDEPQAAPPVVSPTLARVLESAARLQQLVPDAVLVGGSAAALYAAHRDSLDHDHVLADLQDRFDLVLDAVESDPEWVTNRVVPGKIVLGSLGDIETGLRQLIRRAPLETRRVALPSGRTLAVPTIEETLRIKGYLIVKRNQVRDYLDVAALADRIGVPRSAEVLSSIDEFYTDPRAGGRPVCSQLVRQLAEPRPRDSTTLRRLDSYKGLDPRWRRWSEVRSVCEAVAAAMLRTGR